MNAVMRLRLRLQATDDGLTSTVNNASDSVDRLDNTSNSAASSTSNFSSTLKAGVVSVGTWAAGAAVATIAIAGMAAIVRTDAIREIKNLSDTLDVSTVALTEWQYAAGQVGLESDQVGDIFKDVSDKIGDFVTTGGGGAADIFENLNVQAKELRTLSPDEQLLKIAGALDDVNRNQQIFFLESLASDASRLLPLLDNGAQRLIAMRREAKALGVSISDIDADMVRQTSQEFGRLKALGVGTANSLAIEFAPVLKGITSGFVDAVIEVGGFRDGIRTAIDVAVTGIGFLLDYGRQLEIWLTMITSAALNFAYEGTRGMSAYADSIANVINSALYPFQTAFSSILDLMGTGLDALSNIPGPLSDNFKTASEFLNDASSAVQNFTVESSDIATINDSISNSYARLNQRLKVLIESEDPSVVLKQGLQDLRDEVEQTARANEKLKQDSKSSESGTIKTAANSNVIAELELELKLLGKTDRERAISAQTRKLDASATAEQVIATAQLAGRIYDVAEAQKKANEQQEANKQQLSDANSAANQFLQDGNLGEIEGLENIQAQLQAAMNVEGITDKMKDDFIDATDKIQNRISNIKFNNMTDGLSAGMSSMQSMFESGDEGYKAMQIGLAAVTAAQAVHAVINQASGDPYTAFARMAAMAAAVAQLGVAINGGGNFNVSAERQASQGTGTVLGDPTAKSESIAKSNELIAEATEELVGINRSMLDALQSLEIGIDGAALQIVKNFDSSVNASSVTSLDSVKFANNVIANFTFGISKLFESSFSGVVAKVIGASIKGKDSGIVLNDDGESTLSNINAESYMSWKEKKSFFHKSKPKFKTDELDSEVVDQISLVMEGIVDSVSAGAEQLGISSEAIDEAIDNFKLDRTLISLKDLDGEEQKEALDAVFGNIFNDLAGSVVTRLPEFRQVGEGFGQTLARIATEVSAVDNVVGLLGLTFGDVEDVLFAQTSLLGELGGLDNFLSSYSSFSSKFLSDEQQFKNAQSQLESAFSQYDAILPATRDDYLALVQAQDAATTAGAKNIAKLFELSDAADSYYSMLEDNEDERKTIAKEKTSLTLQLHNLEGDSAAALAITRQNELDATDESNHALLNRIWNLQDEKIVEDERLSTAKENSSLTLQLYKLEGDSAAALAITRQNELDATDASNHALLRRIWRLQDEAALEDQILSDVDAAFSALTTAISNDLDALSDAWSKRQTELNDDIALLDESVNGLKSFRDAIKSTLDTLNATSQLDYINAQKEALAWIEHVKNNEWIDIDPKASDEVLGHLGNINADWYENAADYERDKKISDNALRDALLLTESQITTEEQSLKTLNDLLELEQLEYDESVAALNDLREIWQDQVDAVNGVNSSVLNVEDAISTLKSALSDAWENVGVTNSDIRAWLEANADSALTIADIVTAIQQAGITNMQVADALDLNPVDSTLKTNDEFYQWLSNNQTATDVDIANAMRVWGVSIERLAEILDMSVAEVTDRYFETIPDQMLNQYPVDSGMSNDDVYQWLVTSGSRTIEDVAKWMKDAGVTIAQMSEVSGLSQQEVEEAYLGLADSSGLATSERYVDGSHLNTETNQSESPKRNSSTEQTASESVSDDDVSAWLAANSGASNEDIARAMDEYNVSVEQMARVLPSLTEEEIQNEYDRINGSHANGLDTVPFDGYIAQLHKGEMVLPAGQSDYLRNGETAKQFHALALEVAALRRDNKKLLGSIKSAVDGNISATKSLSKGIPVQVISPSSGNQL